MAKSCTYIRTDGLPQSSGRVRLADATVNVSILAFAAQDHHMGSVKMADDIIAVLECILNSPIIRAYMAVEMFCALFVLGFVCFALYSIFFKQ